MVRMEKIEGWGGRCEWRGWGRAEGKMRRMVKMDRMVRWEDGMWERGGIREGADEGRADGEHGQEGRGVVTGIEKYQGSRIRGLGNCGWRDHTGINDEPRVSNLNDSTDSLPLTEIVIIAYIYRSA